MSNTLRVSPGQRASLAKLGLVPSDLGRIINRAVAPPKDVPVPKNADELAEFMGDPGRFKSILGSPEDLKAFIQSYADVQQAPGTDIDAQVQASMAGFLKANGDIKRPNLDLTGAVTPSKHYNAKAPGAQLDKTFGTWADYLPTIWPENSSLKALEARAEIKRIQASFGSTVPSDGGFLIPEMLRAELLRVALESSVVRPRARVVPMETLTVPYPTLDSTSNASSVYGGTVGYWTEEGGALTDSSPKFGRVVLQAKKLTIYSEIPNELFTDSVLSLQAFMAESYPEALAWFEDVAFVRGSGVGEPLGFLNADAAVSVAKEASQGAATIVWENIVKAYSRMLPSSINRAVWIAHIDTFPELATMALSVGTGGSGVWISNGAGSAPMTILGRPVIFSEKVNTVGSAGDINFVDLGYYLIGDRQMMQAETSGHYKFANDKTATRIIERVDGRPWIQSAITPAQGSNTLSPFVKIAVRA